MAHPTSQRRYEMVRVGISWLFVVLFLGCSKGPSQYAIKGTVSYQGKPVPKGTIIFEPDKGAGNTGRGTTAEIENGEYATLNGEGTVGGPHRLVISGYDGVAYKDGPMTNPMGQPLFDERVVTHDVPREDSTFNITLP